MGKTRVEIKIINNNIGKFIVKDILIINSRNCGSIFTIFVVTWCKSFDSHHHHQAALYWSPQGLYVNQVLKREKGESEGIILNKAHVPPTA